MQHLGEDIRREIPESGCFSRINLYYMRWSFELYCMRPIVPQAGEQLKSGKGQLEPIVPQVGGNLKGRNWQEPKDRVTAKYSLEGVSTPIGIADYALEKFLPADFTSDLPNIEAIESDQTRRLQLLLEKNGIINGENDGPHKGRHVPAF